MKDRSKHLHRPLPSRRVTRPVAPGVKAEGSDLLDEIKRLPEETQNLIRRGIQMGIRISLGREALLDGTLTALLYASLPGDMIPDLGAESGPVGFMHVNREAVDASKLFTGVFLSQADGSFLVGLAPAGERAEVLEALKKTIREGGAEEFLASMEDHEGGETLQ